MARKIINGYAVQCDLSGVGHCWKNVQAEDNISDQGVEAWITEARPASFAEMVGDNGLRYRVVAVVATDEQILVATEEAFEAAAEAGDNWSDYVDVALHAIGVAVDAEATREEDEDGFGPLAVLRDGRRIWRAETDGTFSLR